MTTQTPMMVTMTKPVPLLKCETCGKEKPRHEYNTQTYTGLPYGSCRACYNLKRSMKKDKKKHARFIVGMFERIGELSQYGLEDWEQAMIHWGGTCAYCGKRQSRGTKNRLTRDHIVPVTKGGKTTKENIIPCCGSCNRSKNNKLLLEWYPYRTYYTSERLRKILQWMNGGCI